VRAPRPVAAEAATQVSCQCPSVGSRDLGERRFSRHWKPPEQKDRRSNCCDHVDPISDSLGSHGGGIRPGAAFFSRRLGCGQLRTCRGARPGDKPDRHDFSLTQRPPPAACLRIADDLAAYRDGSDLTVPA